MHAHTKLGTQVLLALIDTGATQNFLSHDTAEKLGLTWKENETPKPVTNVDGSKCGTGIITLYCDIPMKLDNLWKEEQFYKAETGTDQVVLGIPWLANFKPTINWTMGPLLKYWRSHYTYQHGESKRRSVGMMNQQNPYHAPSKKRGWTLE